jgi:hypothetical protein
MNREKPKYTENLAPNTVCTLHTYLYKYNMYSENENRALKRSW